MTDLACQRMKTTQSESWETLVDIPNDEEPLPSEPDKNYEG